MLIKLFLPTLLTAMFSTTGSKVSEKSEQLWMYQRYEIVLEYEKRLIFAPPFTVLLYVFYSLRYVLRIVRDLFALVCFRARDSRHQSYDLNVTAAGTGGTATPNNTTLNVTTSEIPKLETERKEVNCFSVFFLFNYVRFSSDFDHTATVTVAKKVEKSRLSNNSSFLKIFFVYLNLKNPCYAPDYDFACAGAVWQRLFFSCPTVSVCKKNTGWRRFNEMHRWQKL